MTRHKLTMQSEPLEETDFILSTGTVHYHAMQKSIFRYPVTVEVLSGKQSVQTC